MILLLPALASCGDRVHVRSTKPPTELLTCSPEPMAPVLPPKDGTEATQLVRDNLTLAYVLAMRAAWGDCSSKLAGVRVWAEALPE